MKEEEDLLNMKLHSKELLYSNGNYEISVMKVYGGWIYTHKHSEKFCSSVFVPNKKNKKSSSEDKILLD